MKRVLIVDDEKAFCRLVKHNLEAGGEYAVTVCTESPQAVAIARQMKPDVVLLDIMMPEKSGIDIAIELKAAPETKAIPVVFLSALVKQDCLDEHKHIYDSALCIAKPFSKEELLTVLKRVLSGDGDASSA